MYGEEMAGYYGLLPSSGTPFASQIYDASTGETWADFFVDYTMSRLAELVKLNDAAKTAGFTLPEEDRQEISQSIESMVVEASMLQYASLDAYLQYRFSPSINEAAFRKIMEFVYTASAYSEFMLDSFTYTPERLTEYYSENSDMLDIYRFRSFQVVIPDVHEDDYDTTEEYEAALEAAVQEAHDTAAEIAAGITDEEAYIAAADLYNEAYDEPESTFIEFPGHYMSDSGAVYLSWLTDAGRAQGDVGTVESTNGVYVLFFLERDKNDYYMAEMRQILMMPDSVDSSIYNDGEEDPLYIEAVAESEAANAAVAEQVFAQFKEAGGTEAALLSLMTEYSDDTTEGGFYNKIAKEQMSNSSLHIKLVPEIEQWLFAPERVAGEYDLIKSEAYGYHLVYFTGPGMRYCDFISDNALRTADYGEWKDKLDAVESAKRWAFIFTSY